jgi:hypothetical protein
VVLTSEPDERLVRKLSRALCAEPASPELSAVPISESSLVNEVLEELDALLEELDALLVEVSPLEPSRLVSES